MTPEELAQSCVRALSHPKRIWLGEPVVGIGGKHKAPLPKRSFPKWKYIAFDDQGRPIYHYPAKELLTALAQHGIINLNDYYVR